MVTRSMSKLAAAAGGVALSVVAGAGIASADELSPAAINTNCSYSQVVAAIQAQSPAAAGFLNSNPEAQQFLRDYLNSGPDQRRAIAAQAEAAHPGASNTYLPVINRAAATCNNF